MKWFLALMSGLVVAASPVQAAGLAPDALVKRVTHEVLAVVRRDKEIRNGNAERAIELVQAQVLPHFDFTQMTALAVGRYWRRATAAQRKALTDEFRTLLVRTYATALTQYRNQTIEYLPFRRRPSDTDVTVRTRIKQPGAESIELDYSLEKVGAEWKVYDIAVDGVSLVTNYRDEFGRQISQSGIAGLIAQLRIKNKAGKTAAATPSSGG
jgi:phospholipid transport system substrate-binding protein